MSEKNSEGQVFVVDNRRRDELIKTVLIIVLIIVFPVGLESVKLYLMLLFFLLVQVNKLERPENKSLLIMFRVLSLLITIILPLFGAATAVQNLLLFTELLF